MEANKVITNPDSTTLNHFFLHLVDNLSGVKELAALSLARLSHDGLIDSVLRILFEHLRSEEVSLYLLQDDQLHRVAHTNWGRFIDNISAVDGSDQHLTSAATPVGKTASELRIHHVKNYANEQRYDETTYSIGSAISAPILSAGKLKGVLEIYHPHNEHFDDWTEYAVAVYADLTGMLLDHHAILSDMQQVLDDTTEDLRKTLAESEKMRKRYEEMSVIDHLTKLYNRRYFFSEVNAGLARAIRYDQPFSLLLMDLDHFKDVNDSFGHDCGDKALRYIADNLARLTREGDTLARYGGEEFIMALPNTDLEGAIQLAERIRRKIEDSELICKDKTIKLTISIGITSIEQYQDLNEDSDNYSPQVTDLIRESDRALYFVKQHGRNGVKAFQQLTG